MDIPLRECTDEQLIAELARRNVDIQHKVTADLVARYYHFEKLLGHGASGKVYLVYHRESGDKFACKVIKKDGSMNDAKSMSTEIEIMKRCRHLNIVSLYELFESSVCMWLILELVEGSGLRGGLLNHAHYTETVCSRFVRQICSGLHYLHNHGVIHRDLKIDNVLLSVRGDGTQHDQTYVKITDFGLSALVKVGTKDYVADESGKRKSYTGLTEMWGTPTHYAPELIDRAYGPQADMWSLGCVIYEMLTGYEAFPSKDGMERKDLYTNIKHARYALHTPLLIRAVSSSQSLSLSLLSHALYFSFYLSPQHLYTHAHTRTPPLSVYLPLILSFYHSFLRSTHRFAFALILSYRHTRSLLLYLSSYDKKRLNDLHISAEAQDLLEKILKPDPVARLSASEALKHPWVSGEGHHEQHSRRLNSVYEMFGSGIHLHDDSEEDASKTKRNGLGAFAYLFGSSSQTKLDGGSKGRK